MSKKDGGEAEVIVSDLTDTAKTKELCERVKNTDILVLNASLQYRTPWEAITLEACQEQLDCVGIVSLLCSKQGRYITGQNIFVDGGKSVL